MASRQSIRRVKMKSVALALVAVLVLAGSVFATDHHAVRERVVVEKVYRAPIVERVVELKEVPRVRVVERVEQDYGYADRVVQRVEIRRPVVVEKQVVRVEKQRTQKVVKVEKVRNQGFLGRLLNR